MFWVIGNIINMFVDARLRSLMEMCILIPGISSKLHQNGGTNSQVSFFSFRILSPEPIWLNWISNGPFIVVNIPTLYFMLWTGGSRMSFLTVDVLSLVISSCRTISTGMDVRLMNYETITTQ